MKAVSSILNYYWTINFSNHNFNVYYINFTGLVTLSPMSVAPVCPTGDPLQLTCTASIEFQRWNILRANEQGTLVDIINYSEIINSRDPIQMRDTPLPMSSATITYSRTSAQGASPLVSTLSIDSVSIGLNGTVIRCSDVSNPMSLASTTIIIIDTSQSELPNHSQKFTSAYFLHL